MSPKPIAQIPKEVTDDMWKTVDTYSNFSSLTWPAPKQAAPAKGKVIFMTGGTGALGSHLLSNLLLDDTVEKVYAFNRKGTDPLTFGLDRIMDAFEDKGLDPAPLWKDRSKFQLLEGDLTKDRLGLKDEVLATLAGSVTTIIHNAWPVNFKNGLEFFLPIIKASRNLISFALACSLKPEFIFSSTFAVVHNGTPTPAPQKEALVPADFATLNGYMKSKWVVEQMLDRASRAQGLKVLVVRVGQLCGGVNGSWRKEEWMPALVYSSVKLGMFPDSGNEGVTWVTLPIAASAYADFVKHSYTGVNVVHMVHPKPITWHSVATVISKELNLPLVSFEEWFEALRKATEETTRSQQELAKDFPTIKILGYVKSFLTQAANSEYVCSVGIPNLDVTNACRLSPTMRDPSIPRLTDDNVRNWLGYWGLLRRKADRKELMARL